MVSWTSRLALTAQRNRQDIVKAQLSRREMMRLGLLTAGGTLVAKVGLSSRAFGQSVVPPSPPTTPWVQPLPPIPVKTSVNPGNMTGGSPDGTTLIERATQRAPHQLFRTFPPLRFYEIVVREAQHQFSPNYSPSTVWGYDGQVPGPHIQAYYGQPILVRFHNRLPSVTLAQNFGIAEISTHLHNGHTPTESDGFPVDYVNSINDPTALSPLGFKDHHYPNVYAGYTARGDLVGDPREALSSLWYHDHHVEFTAQNVYKGLYGIYTLFDALDTGDETTGLRLPSGNYDVPIMFSDPLFDQNCQLVFDLFNIDGVLGDKFAANGAIQPFFEVDRRRYRLRLYNTGPSRWYEFALFDGTTFLPFWQISSDGNLLPQAVQVSSVRLSVAERADIIVDFGQVRASKLYLVNILEQVNGRGPTGNISTPGQGIVQFLVGATAPDFSRDPSTGGPFTLRDLPDPDMNALLTLAGQVTARNFSFDTQNGAWTINGQVFDETMVGASPTQESVEVWTLNNGPGWSHPIHMHFEEFRPLVRNGTPVAPGQINSAVLYARKDILPLAAGDNTSFLMRFRDMKGRHVMHCHNAVHEDHAMMMRWDIV